jgi:magnesium transporter
MPDAAALQYLDELLFGYLRRDFIPLLVTQTVDQALEFLRSQQLGERLIYFYVVDTAGKLVGVVPTRRLLMASRQTPVAQIMVADVLTLSTSATVRDATEMFHKHRLLALPVVDSAGHLHGVADVGMFAGEISDLAARQSADDVFQLIGAHITRPIGPWRGFVDRFPWLLCNIAGGLIAALIAGIYEALLDAVIVLALFMPVVLAVSESVAMQSVTLTLQSLHGPRPSWRLLMRGLRRELAAALLLGAGCAVVIGSAVWAWKRAPLVAAVIGVTVTASMTTAAVLGVALPGTLRAMRRDPRIAAGPIVLALADFLALTLYFNVARWILR